MNDHVIKYFKNIYKVCFTVMHRFCSFCSGTLWLLIKQAQTPLCLRMLPLCPLWIISNIDGNNNKRIYHLLIVSAAVRFLLLRLH